MEAETETKPVELAFDYSGTPRNISVLESLVGESGTLSIRRLTITFLDSEDHFLLAGVTDTGDKLTAEQVRRRFNLPATIHPLTESGSPRPASLRGAEGGLMKMGSFCNSNSTTSKQRSWETVRNANFFEEEIEKLNRWASDRPATLKNELIDYDSEIAELKKLARTARNLPEKLAMQKKILTLDKKRDEAWKEYDEAARDIERQNDALIDRVETHLKQDLHEETLFTIRWKLI